MGNAIVDSIPGAITALKKVEENYETMKDDTDLPLAFHAAGQRPGLVRQTLEIVKDELKSVHLAGNDDAMRSLEECSTKVELLQDMFERIALEPQTSRRARYFAVVRQHGREAAVEVLMVRIMETTLIVAEDSAVKKVTEAQAKELHNAIAKLSQVEPSMPNEGGNQFSHYGSGPQLNNTGLGTQYNNTGSGSQYHADAMHFGSR
ncbi:SesA protein [Thelonectria olida]|uniref:SesA protein n=1 Tax=Thelonectria olida TaxID=1576542 RepID=A0A9P8VWK2_9HYPO|nr:SesA protein [Thelonectria olida]